MALTQTVLNANNGSAAAPKRVYELVRKGLYPVQLLDINEVEDRGFGDKANEKVTKLSFSFVICDPDSHFYGSRVWPKNVTPVLSAPDGDKKESNLHKIVKQFVNNGANMTKAQIDAFTKDPVGQLNALIGRQLEAYVVIETGKTKVENPETGVLEFRKRNIIQDLSPLADSYPAYVPPAPKLDPRNEGEDASITCEFEDEPCSNVIRGWEKRNGEWMSQQDWVEHQDAKYGGHYCGRHLRIVKERSSEAALPF